MLSITQAAIEKQCHPETIRRAIRLKRVNSAVLNPEDSKHRWIVRVFVDDLWREWQPQANMRRARPE